MLLDFQQFYVYLSWKIFDEMVLQNYEISEIHLFCILASSR